MTDDVSTGGKMSLSARRAWIEIKRQTYHRYESTKSLSARRAWIEISEVENGFAGVLVALRKESVDRNHVAVHCVCAALASLSARRAWIEIERLFMPSH